MLRAAASAATAVLTRAGRQQAARPRCAARAFHATRVAGASASTGSADAPLRHRSLAEVCRATSVSDAQRGSLLARAEQYNTLKVDVHEDGIAEVLLDRPKKMNALNMEMWEEIHDVFDFCSRDADVRVVVLGASGDHFCSGMDLAVFGEMQQLSASETCDARRREQLMRIIDYFQTGISAPERCTKPVIASLHGSVIGGAVDLITACDMRYCSADARFSVKEVDLAIVADVGTMQRLPHIVGDQRARELTYTGRMVSGSEAQEIGLVLDAFPDAASLREHVFGVARMIAQKSPVTVRGIKQVSLYTRDHPTDDALNQVKLWNSAMLYSDDLRKAMSGATDFRSD